MESDLQTFEENYENIQLKIFITLRYYEKFSTSRGRLFYCYLVKIVVIVLDRINLVALL